MSTKSAWVVAAALLATSACSSDEVTDKPGRLHPQPDGHGGSGGGGGDDGNVLTPERPSTGQLPRLPGGGNGPVIEVEDPEGPWPVQDVVRYGPGEGIPGRVTGVGVDDGQNVYVIDGNAVYAAKAGEGQFTRTGSGGQFDTGHVAYSVCGGAPGRVYVGYLSYEKEPSELTEEEKLLGDLDRFALQEDGSLSLEFHHRLQNSTAKWMDHTRSILDCARVVGGPNHGDLFVGSNHGLTVIRGDDYADHRHSVWRDENGSQAIGYIWGVNVDTAGNALFAGHWKLAAVPPPPVGEDILVWLDHHRTKWIADTHPEVWGSVEEPDEMHAIAGDTQAGRIYVGSWGKGLAAMDFAPRKWTNIAGTPDTHINALELDPTDGKLWVGTANAGLWRWDPATEAWEKSPHVPDGRIHDVYLDTTVSPRAVYVGTNSGLYVIRAQ
ncbi:hypothetical protein [Vulgatibacter sp.]|uniref:hypothetical protein n=1 Tax=Vulgatibacter sp. TaxID=1971226 RepID=UPI0035696A47